MKLCYFHLADEGAFAFVGDIAEERSKFTGSGQAQSQASHISASEFMSFTSSVP